MTDVLVVLVALVALSVGAGSAALGLWIGGAFSSKVLFLDAERSERPRRGRAPQRRRVRQATRREGD